MQLLVTKQPTAVDVVAGLQMQAVVDFRKISFLFISLANFLVIYDTIFFSCVLFVLEKEPGSNRTLK